MISTTIGCQWWIEMAARHIAFQEGDQSSYIGAILHGIEGERDAARER